jgi:hypothetical protein
MTLVPDDIGWSHIEFSKEFRAALDAKIGVLCAVDPNAKEWRMCGSCFVVNATGETAICIGVARVLHEALRCAGVDGLDTKDQKDWSVEEIRKAAANLRLFFPGNREGRILGVLQGWSVGIGDNFVWLRVHLPGRQVGAPGGVMAIDSDLHPVGIEVIYLAGADLTCEEIESPAGKKQMRIGGRIEARAGRVTKLAKFGKQSLLYETSIAVPAAMRGGPVLGYRPNSNGLVAALGVIAFGDGELIEGGTVGRSYALPIGSAYAVPLPLPSAGGGDILLKGYVSKTGIIDVGSQRRQIRVRRNSDGLYGVDLPTPLEDLPEQPGVGELLAGSASEQPRRLCVFCGIRTGNSNEHVFSEWTAKLLGTLAPQHQEMHARFSNENGQVVRTASRVKTLQGDAVSRKTKGTCELCNNGWMSEIENTVKLIATPLIQRQPTELNAVHQQALAVWTMLKTLVAELVFPSKRSYGPFLYEWFHAHRTPHPGSRVYVATFDGGKGPFYNAYPLLREDESGLTLEALCAFLSWKHLLIVHVWSAQVPCTFDFPERVQKRLAQIFPSSGPTLVFPSDDPVDKSCLDEMYTAFTTWNGAKI